MTQAELIQVRKAMGGISCPATKNQLAGHAKGNSASEDILGALNIPDRDHDGRTRSARPRPSNRSKYKYEEALCQARSRSWRRTMRKSS